MTKLPIGTTLTVFAVEGDWDLIEFADNRWGPRRGYIHCSNATALPLSTAIVAPVPLGLSGTALPESAPGAPDFPQPHRSAPPNKAPSTVQHSTVSLDKQEALGGYVEWLRPDFLIADGQRVRWNDDTQLDLGRIRSVQDIPLGYEIKVQGARASDGSLVARRLEVKPNGTAAFEREVQSSSDALEETWLRRGAMFVPTGTSKQQEIGRIVDSGPDVDRVRRILTRVTPPYVGGDHLHVHVVQSNDWNASAMPNGSIWVYSGLLLDLNDDELAIVLGHELAHYTHEHSRRQMKQAMFRQLAAAGVQVALEKMDSSAGQLASAVGATLALNAWKNGYSRVHEDQADRVGLRYAYEGQYDVAQGPRLWARFREKYGEADRMTNLFMGDHSRPTERIGHLERELRVNYTESGQTVVPSPGR